MSTTLPKFRFLIVTFIMWLACSPAGKPSLPIETDVCAIVADPKDFAGRRLVLNTSISADGMHLALLMGPACERGIQFQFTHAVPEAVQQQIRSAIFEPWPGTTNKVIRGRFEGTLRRDREEERLFPYYLEVEKVANLDIKIGERPW